jgi:putative ABC transport system ATP-binding protein
MSLIKLRGITRRYVKGDHAVTPLHDADLDVEQGSFFVLLGPSGSGKTTLLNLIAGIDRPDEGQITVAGQDLSAIRGGKLAQWRAANVGYIFQQHHLIPVLTAYENVELPLHLFSMTSKQRHDRVALALDAVGLLDRADHLPRQLSGGQEQRVAIARSIVADPPIIVADEPTGDLDRESADGILRLLQRLVSEYRKTIVMVTHDLDAAKRGTQVMHLVKGKLMEERS